MDSKTIYHWCHYPLRFKRTIGTSRGSLTERDTYFLIQDNTNCDNPQERFRIGEVGYLPGLTRDNWSTYTEVTKSTLPHLVQNIIKQGGSPDLSSPALCFAWEMIFSKNSFLHPPPDSDFLQQDRGIPINGLVWMGSKDFQREQILNLLTKKFTTIKIKIGAINFSDDLALLDFLFLEAERRRMRITVRLDANGSLGTPESEDESHRQESPQRKKEISSPHLDLAMERLRRLSHHPIHSIEQPIPPLYQEKMSPRHYRTVMEKSPIPIAWDEELIGITSLQAKQEMLDHYRPKYLVLKPGLHGGFVACEEWIRLAEERRIGWWITSSLESSLGLTAITRWTASLLSRYSPTTPITQGLGTGTLYSNNFSSPLALRGNKLFYNHHGYLNDKMINSFLKKVNCPI